jgi:hypothetical protein
MLERIANIRACVPNRSKRWQPTRLFVQNLFHITYQEFHFVDGRLALNGANGTGKSTVACLALPIVLDMIKARQRFDPFGGGARNPAYLLLGNPKARAGDPGFYDTRTAYAALEFQHGETDAFITIGVGLYATRADGPDPKLESWGFVARDRRIGDDFALMTPDGDPLSRRELAEILGSANVFERNREYQQAVNAALFGFDHVDDLTSLTSDIFELKKPKLDRPDREVLDASLRGSLPSLPADVTDDLADLIAKIEHAADMLAETQEHVTLVTELHAAQGNYANQTAQEAAVEVQAVAGDIAAARHEYEQASDRLRRLSAERDVILARITATKERLNTAAGALEVAKNSEAYKSLESQEAISGSYAQAVNHADRAMADRVRAQSALDELEEKRQRLDQAFFGEVADWQGRAESLAQAADEVSWTRIIPALDAYRVALQGTRVDATGDDPVDAMDESLITADAGRRTRELAVLADAIAKAHDADAAVQKADALLNVYREERTAANDAHVASNLVFVDAEEAALTALESAVAEATPVLALDTLLPESQVAIRAAAGSRAELVAALQPMQWAIATARATQEALRLAADADAREWTHKKKRLTQEHDRIAAEPFATPVPRAGVEAARARISAAGFRAVPFFEAVEVCDGADPAALAQVEASLTEAGILDALLIHPADSAGVDALLGDTREIAVADRWLLAATDGPPGAEVTARRTLAALLRPAERVAADARWRTTVRETLASLPVEARAGQGGTHFRLDGAWQQGLLAGRSSAPVDATGAPAPRYLGITNRERHRAAELQRLEAEIADATAAADAATGRHEEAHRQVAALEDLSRALRDLAALRALEDAARARAQFALALTRANKRLTEADAQVTVLRVQLQQAHAAVQEAAQGFPELRHASVRVVTEARHATRRIADDCTALARDTRRGLTGLRERNSEIEIRRGDLEAEIQEHSDRIADAQDVVMELKGKLDEIERALKGTDAEALRARIASLQATMKEAAEENLKYEKQESENGADVRNAKLALDKRQNEFVAAESRIHAVAHTFESRLKAYPEESMRRALEIFDQAGTQGGPEAAATELLRKRKHGPGLADNVEKSAREASILLIQKFNGHKTALNKYRPEITSENWTTLVMVSDGRRLHPGAFLERLRMIEEEQRQVVSAAEHELYVNFFLNNMLAHLRQRMLLAREFVAQVDGILKAMRLSNGQRFRLTWTPKAEEGVGAVNYSDLVTFVQADPETVTPARRQAMMTVFQQRLETVRAEQKGLSRQSYRERLAAEFDYRSWFEFRFFFKREIEPEMELKGRAIEELSGGERTAAQILPLLSCLHARSLGARPDAPKLMGLDEAFAGTDTANTEKMLAMLVDLEFSYIMVGDRVTGDSRAVPACAAYNLLARGTVITPVLYVWDGTRRVRMSEETVRREMGGEHGDAQAAEGAASGLARNSPAGPPRALQVMKPGAVLPVFIGKEP